MRIPIKANIDTYNDIIAEVKQLDDITLELSLYRDGEAFDVTGQTVSLRVRRTDGAIIEQTTMIGINKNVVTIEVKNICFAVAGNVEMELNLVDAKGSISTSTFYIAVGNIVLNEETLPESDIGILNEAKELEPVRVSNENIRVTNESTRDSNENIRIANENARKNNEVIRQQAETNRVDVFNHNENERKSTFDSNENSRKNIFETNEVNRQNTFSNNEATRRGNEDTRISNENERKKAETIRLSNENTRANAETGRVNAENKRVTDENKRASAEIVRGNSESARVSAETTRNTNESNRVTAENNRVNAESNRIIAENNRQLEVTKAREDYFHITHEDLYKRLYEDFKKVWLEFQNASLLSYEGNYITANNTLLGNTDSLVLKGRTLQNLCNCSPIVESDFSSTDYSNLCNFIRNSDLIKKNTVYTFIVDYELINLTQLSQSEFLVGVDLRYKKDDNTFSSTNLGIPYLKENKSEFLKIKFDTTNFVNYSGNVDKFVLVSKNCSGHIKIKNGLILEGDWTNKEVPSYFEGIKSVEGNLSIKSCSKNLCDNSKNQMIDISPTDGKEWGSKTSVISDYIRIRDKSVIGSFKRVNTDLNLNSITYRVYDNNKNFIGADIGLLKIGYYLRLRVIVIKDSLNITTPQDVLFQLEYGTTATEFESYVEDKITVNGLILRDQDTLDNRGVLTRKYGVVSLNDASNWYYQGTTNSNSVSFYSDAIDNALPYQFVICNVLPSIAKDINTQENNIYISGTKKVNVNISKSKIPGYSDLLTSTEKVSLFKNWLKTNALFVQYILEVQIMENINFRNLNSYKGTTNIITDGTLIQPLISTKIPSNVQRVVSSLQAENTSLNNQVSTLNLENAQFKSQNTEQQANIDNLNDVTNTLIKSSL